jgi:hypothetical protein
MWKKTVKALTDLKVLVGTLFVGFRLWDAFRDNFDDWL